MQATTREPIRILVLAASLRADSLNLKLARLAARALETGGARVESAAIRDFDVPSYDQDLERQEGLAAGAAEFCRRLEAVDGLVIASPEYNASMPGLLKNLIDWASRKKPQPFNERHALLMSASPSMVGGNRGLWALRVPLEHLGARVFPDMFSLAQAHQAFDADGGIQNAELRGRFEKTLRAFADLTEAAKHYPCIRKAWVEFLGEKPDPAFDRVE